MPTYVIYDVKAKAALWLATQPSAPKPPAGLAWLEVPRETALGGGGWDVIDGALVARQPTVAHHRVTRAAAAMNEHAARIAAGFCFAGKLYQIDPASQARIAALGAAALASTTAPAAIPWPAGFAWIAADNSETPMDARVMQAFARAAALHVSGCALNLRRIKNEIAAASTEGALAAIDITAGYPSALA